MAQVPVQAVDGGGPDVRQSPGPRVDDLGPLVGGVTRPHQVRGQVVERIAVGGPFPADGDQGRGAGPAGDDQVVAVQVGVEQAVGPAGQGRDPLRQPGQGVLGDAERGEQAAERAQAGPSDLLVGQPDQGAQEPLAVRAVAGPAGRRGRQRPAPDPGRAGQQTGERLDEQRVDGFAVAADGGERYAVHMAVDGEVVVLDQAFGHVRQDGPDGAEHRRLVRPGAGRRGRLAGPPDAHRDEGAGRPAEQPGQGLRQRCHIGVVVPAADRPALRDGPAHEGPVQGLGAALRDSGGAPTGRSGTRRGTVWQTVGARRRSRTRKRRPLGPYG